MKAFLFGSIAATVGAAVYRMILFGTGWNIGLVAVVVGYMVGGAVRTGSGERGGRFYQFLAVFLTYSAIVGMFVPEFWQASPDNAARKAGRGRTRKARFVRRPARSRPGMRLHRSRRPPRRR